MNGSEISDSLVVGGGLAGASTACALAKKGISVTLCESENRLAPKASGNEWGLLMPYVATENSAPGRLYAQGFRFTHAMFADDVARRVSYQECGAIQLPSTKRLARIVTEDTPCVGDISIRRVSAAEGSSIAGTTLLNPSFYIPQAGFCKPAHVTEALVENNERVAVKLSARVIDLQWEGSSWTATLNDGTSISTPLVVLCGAHEIQSLSITQWVPLEPIRGQTAIALSNQSSSTLRTIVSYDGYLTPSHGGQHFVGAHYRHHDFNPEPDPTDTQEIMSRLYRALPSISGLVVNASRVCFRTSTFDRLPYVGALPLNEGRNLFINAGHGSRGLLTAPLGGEIVARLATNEDIKELEESSRIASAERLRKRMRHS